MKTLRAVAVGSAVLVLTAGIFFGSTFHSSAQFQLPADVARIQPEPAQTVSEKPDTVVRIVAESQGFSMVPVEKLPRYGTYWEALTTYGQIMAPMPWLPADAVQVYEIAPNQFLVDNGQAVVIPQPLRRSKLPPLTPEEFVAKQVEALVGLVDQVQTAQLNSELEKIAAREAASSKTPRAGAMSRMSLNGLNTPSSVPETNLWILVPTNALAVPTQLAVILTNTFPGEPYDVLTKSDLNNPVWAVEVAATYAQTNSIPVQLYRNGRTNLFVWARFAGDSTGSGIPDWWQLKYFGTVGIDPYGDPDGDGWNNLQEYQNGTSPNAFNTPPPLTGIRLTADGSGHNVVNWSATSVVPSTFTVQRNTGSGWQTVATISGSLGSFTDTGLPANTSASYQVRADYPSGSSSYALYNFTTIDPLLNLPAAVTAGPGGRLFVAYSTPSLVVTGLVVTATPFASVYPKDGMYLVNSSYPYTVFYGNNNIPVSGLISPASLTGAPLRLSTGFVPNYGFYNFTLYTVGQNGKYGTLIQPGWTANAVPFLDGRQHTLDNLNFILRAGTVTVPFDFYFSTAAYNQTEAKDYGIFPTYTTAGFNGKNNAGYLTTYDWIDELQPFEDSSIFRAFCYTTNRFDNFGTPLDAGFDGVSLPTMKSWNYYFSSLAYAQAHNTNTPPRQIDSTNAQYLFYGPVTDGNDVPDLGLTWNGSIPGWQLSSSARNVYGLKIVSVRVVKATQSSQPLTIYTASAGGTIPALSSATDPNGDGWFYFQTEYPGFQNVGWHVAAGTLESRFGPGFPSWNGTNTIDVPILNVGDELHMAAWAKLSVTNASVNSIAYLQHYFDKAYRMGGNGIATTNQTGILSEYGDFLATEPGATALITKPDLATGLSCTSVVQVIALNADANHDGIMDFTFAGPDYVTTNNPFRFWINDNQDHGDDMGNGIPGQPGIVADGTAITARDGSGNAIYTVHGTRDLVDFFPVYVNVGGLIPLLPPGGSVRYTLRQADGALRFAYTTLNATNYLSYLRDSTVAPSLAAASLVTVPPSGVDLTSAFLNGIPTQNAGIILVEAWTNTTSPLILDVWQGTNLVGETELALSISGVEQMFRHKNLIRAMNPNSSVGFPDRLTSAEVPNEPQTSTNNLLFIHGYNVNPTQARGWFADTYKRFYWSGSHAKFYGVNWNGYESQTFTSIPRFTSTPNYQINVVHAFQTAPLLATFIASLTNGPTIVAAHSLGNMVALSALSDWAAPMSQYFMLDAAVPIEAIDPNAIADTNMIFPDWLPYTNRLYASDWCQLFPTNDYRSTLSWNGRLANFGSTTVYNFYSSGEEVLRTYTNGAPPANLFSLVYNEIKQYLDGQSGLFSWAWEEKCKGRMFFNSILSSSHGGWGFNSDYDIFPSGLRTHLPPDRAATNSTLQLQAAPFFDNSFDAALYTTNSSGSTYAQTNRNRILSDAIPALTLPVGANPVARLQPTGRNFNMQLNENNWPVTTGDEAFKWYHSDIRQKAYTFTYKVFNEMVNDGNLK